MKVKSKKTVPRSDEEMISLKKSLEMAEKAHERLFQRTKTSLLMTKTLVQKPDLKTKRKKRFLKKHGLELIKPSDVDDDYKLLPVTVNRSNLERAMNLLESVNEKPKGQQELIKGCCMKRLLDTGDEESWDTANTIIKHVKQAVSGHDWNSLTELLILLLDHNPYYLPFVKEMCFLNFLMNPSDYNSEVLDAFVQQLFTNTTGPPGEFDISFVDDT